MNYFAFAVAFTGVVHPDADTAVGLPSAGMDKERNPKTLTDESRTDGESIVHAFRQERREEWRKTVGAGRFPD